MTDHQLDELLLRAAEGDEDAQRRIDAWIAEMLGSSAPDGTAEFPRRELARFGRITS